jgi:hypothetical protein
MSASRWNAPADSIIAKRFLHPTHVRHLNAVHRLDCQLLARVPLARVRAVHVDALGPTDNVCPHCLPARAELQSARRDPARVEAPPRRDAPRTGEAERDQ